MSKIKPAGWRVNLHFSERLGKSRVTWRVFNRGRLIAQSVKAHSTEEEARNEMTVVAFALADTLKR